MPENILPHASRTEVIESLERDAENDRFSESVREYARRKAQVFRGITDEQYELECRQQALMGLARERDKLLDKLKYTVRILTDDHELDELEWRAYVKARIEYLDSRIELLDW